MGHRMCSSSTLVLVQLRKTHPEVTERLLTGVVKNQIKKTKKKKKTLGITQEVNIPVKIQCSLASMSTSVLCKQFGSSSGQTECGT